MMLRIIFMSMISVVTMVSGVQQKQLVLFADEHDPHNRLLTLDYNAMTMVGTPVAVEGSLNHHADVIGTLEAAKYVMMVPKGSEFVTFRKTSDRSFVKKLDLPFNPRSADAYNATHDLTLLTAANRPSAVVIDNHSLNIVAQAGFNIRCNVTATNMYEANDITTQTCTTTDFGGTQVSGHPIWLDSQHFVILDRANRYLHVYRINRVNNQWNITFVKNILTNSSMHQLIVHPNNPNIFYGMTEGSQTVTNGVTTTVRSRIYKFSYSGNGNLIEDVHTVLERADDTFKDYGGHNLYITPDASYLYGVTFTGGVFVVDSDTMDIYAIFIASRGAGHVNFREDGDYGVITNHGSPFVTVFNYKTHGIIQQVNLPFARENIASLVQSHSPYIEGKYYYNFWTDGGVFFRVDLDTLVMDRSLYVGGVPIQGNYFKTIRDDASVLENETKLGQVNARLSRLLNSNLVSDEVRSFELDVNKTNIFQEETLGAWSTFEQNLSDIIERRALLWADSWMISHPTITSRLNTQLYNQYLQDNGSSEGLWIAIEKMQE